MRHVGDARHEVLEHELIGERASALGDAGRRVERALAALREAEADEREACSTRPRAPSGTSSFSARRWGCATASLSSPTMRSRPRC